MKFGRDALIEAGIPHEFVALVMWVADKFGCVVGFRAGGNEKTPQLTKLTPITGKPIDIKTRTCTPEQHIKMLTSLLPINQKLFGLDDNAPLPKNGYRAKQLPVSLYEILCDASRGEYNQLVINGTHLEFRAAKAANEKIKDHVIFKIDLDNFDEPLEYAVDPNTTFTPWLTKNKIKKPDYWHEGLGDFEQALNKLYPVSYMDRDQGDKDWKPLDVIADNKGHIITSDIDCLWFAKKKELASSPLNKKLNASNAAECAQLLAFIKQLCHESDIGDLKQEILELESIAALSGVTTPYDAFLATIINKLFNRSLPYDCNMILHGSDVFNPVTASPFYKTLIVGNGIICLAENEVEHVQCIMRDGFLEVYDFPMHPAWNMQKWHVVVEKQLSLGRHIEPDVLQHYYQYIKNNQQPSTHDRSLFKYDAQDSIESFVIKHTVEKQPSSKQCNTMASQNIHTLWAKHKEYESDEAIKEAFGLRAR